MRTGFRSIFKFKVEKLDCRLVHLNFSTGISSLGWIRALRSWTKVPMLMLSRNWIHYKDHSDALW